MNRLLVKYRSTQINKSNSSYNLPDCWSSLDTMGRETFIVSYLILTSLLFSKNSYLIFMKMELSVSHCRKFLVLKSREGTKFVLEKISILSFDFSNTSRYKNRNSDNKIQVILRRYHFYFLFIHTFALFKEA